MFPQMISTILLRCQYSTTYGNRKYFCIYRIDKLQPSIGQLSTSRTYFQFHTIGLIYSWLYLRVLNQIRSEEHTSELQSRGHLVCRLLLEKKKKQKMLADKCMLKTR